MSDTDQQSEFDQLTDDQRASVEERVKGELIALGWRNAATMTALGPLILVAVYFGIEGRVSPQSLWIWLSAHGVFMLGRLVMVSAWAIRKPQGRRRLRWGWYFLATMLFAVGFFGALAPVFVHQLDPLRQAFIFTVVTGTAGGSVSAFSSHRPTLIVVPAVMLMPTAATCFFMGGDTLPILGALAVVYCAYLIRAGLEHGRTQSEALRLRFERTALVDDLRSARDAAESANRAKSEFLANMSHELRTPLNAILGFSEMMQLSIFEKSVPERFRDYAKLIHLSGAHLLELISDLLDISKAEAGALELQEEEVDLAEHVATSVELLAAVARKSNITLSGPADLDATICLHADGRKLRQILFNLISNAIKFTPGGGAVKVAVGESPDGGIELVVADTGIGMTQDQIEMALKPFVQIDQGYSKRYPGTGLGLPLAKTLTELHGGRFTVESELGQGTTVRVLLPAERVLTARARKSA